jgi:hypothetical protein
VKYPLPASHGKELRKVPALAGAEFRACRQPPARRRNGWPGDPGRLLVVIGERKPIYGFDVPKSPQGAAYKALSVPDS